MAGGRDARAKARGRQQHHHADAAAVLDKLNLLEKTTLDHLNELADAVQQGEALHTYLPALAAALPAARSSLLELQAQEMEQLKAKVLSLVAGGELAGAPIAGTMKGYFGDLFDEGDENGSADLDLSLIHISEPTRLV